MPARKHPNNDSSLTNTLDRLLADMEGEVLLAGALGGLAAANGIVPPFTRLLMMFGGAAGGQEGLKGDLDTVSKNLAVGALFQPVMAPAAFWTWLGSVVAPGPEVTPEQKADAKATLALACSGALEGMMMMRLMRNPQILETIIKQPAEMLKGIGEIVPG